MPAPRWRLLPAAIRRALACPPRAPDSGPAQPRWPAKRPPRRSTGSLRLRARGLVTITTRVASTAVSATNPSAGNARPGCPARWSIVTGCRAYDIQRRQRHERQHRHHQQQVRDPAQHSLARCDRHDRGSHHDVERPRSGAAVGWEAQTHRPGSVAGLGEAHGLSLLPPATSAEAPVNKHR